jgi:hypothetical protein
VNNPFEPVSLAFRSLFPEKSTKIHRRQNDQESHRRAEAVGEYRGDVNSCSRGRQSALNPIGNRLGDEIGAD